jgi:hypothetical protein
MVVAAEVASDVTGSHNIGLYADVAAIQAVKLVCQLGVDSTAPWVVDVQQRCGTCTRQ